MNRIQKAFTLVEILIVVIILGILAAIVIPQFTQASSDARDSALTSDLQTLRSQLALYRVQHNDNFPAAASFEAQMTTKTNADGTTTGTPTLGPYMQTLPKNPVTGVSTVATGTADPTGSATGGWYYKTSGPTDSASNIYANDDGKTTGGTTHISL
jgi:general secretion pathway protein G